MADPDPLDDLRAQVRATQDAARRLMDEAIPPGGWEAPRERHDAFGEEVQALASMLQALRDLLPPDLREQVTELVRQLLLVLRALIDWWVSRLEEAPDEPGEPPVEDIPIS
ncbi:MAG TPA: hypothetical protein VFR97_14875 [Capillimicrobium sp.]|nr:hypothetical protein [Capillimicrobium sp.]